MVIKRALRRSSFLWGVQKYSALRFALIGDSFHFGFQSFLIAQVVVAQNIHIIIKFVDQRDTGRDVEIDDFLIRNVVKIFHEGAQGVAMSGDDDVLSVFDIGFNDFFPIGNDTVDCGLQGFCQRQFILINFGVVLLVSWSAFVIFCQRGRADIKAASPDLDLLIAILGGGVGLVQPLQSAIMAFVELPALFYRNIVFVQFVKDMIQRVDGSFQIGGVGLIKGKADL